MLNRLSLIRCVLLGTNRKYYSRLTFTNCDDQLLAFMKMKDVNGYVLQRNMMDQYKTLLNLTVSQIEDAQTPAEEQAELS